MSILYGILLFIHVIICLLMVLLVMLQRPKQEGLGAAFASGMMNDLAGPDTTNILQKGTRTFAIVFFVIATLLAMMKAHEHRQNDNLSVPTPIEDPTPAVPGSDPLMPNTDPVIPGTEPVMPNPILPEGELPALPKLPDFPIELPDSPTTEKDTPSGEAEEGDKTPGEGETPAEQPEADSGDTPSEDSPAEPGEAEENAETPEPEKPSQS